MKKKCKKSAQRKYVNQCVLQENKSLTSKQEYKADVYIEDDKNCQINRRPVKSKKDMQFKKPSKLKSSYKKKELTYIYEDKNCQDTMCENTDYKSQSSKCSDKNCQENRRPKKHKSHMQSMTNTDDMQLPKPAIRRLCNDKNCQSTRCYKKY